MSRSRIAANARPMRDRTRLRASRAKITSSTSISRYSFWTRVSDAPSTSIRVPNSGGHRRGPADVGRAGHLRPLPKYVLPDEDQTERDDRQVQPAQAHGQRRDQRPASADIAPAASSQTGTSVIPKPSSPAVRVAGQHRRGVGADGRRRRRGPATPGRRSR